MFSTLNINIITHTTLQGHLTNTKQSRVNSDAAQALASSPKDVLNSTEYVLVEKLGKKRKERKRIYIAPLYSV